MTGVFTMNNFSQILRIRNSDSNTVDWTLDITDSQMLRLINKVNHSKRDYCCSFIYKIRKIHFYQHSTGTIRCPFVSLRVKEIHPRSILKHLKRQNTFSRVRSPVGVRTLWCEVSGKGAVGSRTGSGGPYPTRESSVGSGSKEDPSKKDPPRVGKSL